MYGDDDEDFDDDEAIEFGTDFGGDEEVIGFASDFGDDDEEESDTREAMEAVLDEEEEEEMAAEPEEEEVSVDAEETEIAQEDLPSGCPKGFALNFLWLDKYIAIAVDQIFGNRRRSPLTEYFIWPRTDAWEELRERLSENPWIDETDQILLLNRATEVINYWQGEDESRTLDDARLQFPDCVFMGS